MIQGHIAAEGQGLERQVARTTQTAIKGLERPVAAQGQRQPVQGQAPGLPAVLGRFAAQFEAAALALQGDVDRIPAAIELGRDRAAGGRGLGFEAQLTAAAAESHQAPAPGFFQPQGAGPGLVHHQMQIGHQSAQATLQPALGSESALEPAAHQGAESGQGKIAQPELGLQFPPTQPPARLEGHRQRGGGLQMLRFQLPQLQLVALQPQGGLPTAQ